MYCRSYTFKSLKEYNFVTLVYYFYLGTLNMTQSTETMT